MPQVNAVQIYILNKRAKIMKFLRKEGWTDTQIAQMFYIDPSVVNRILITEKKYKEFAKLKLHMKPPKDEKN